MCKMAEYPKLYTKASEILRREKINTTIPGYEFLKRAIVIYCVEKGPSKEKLIEIIKKEGMVIPINKDLSLKRKGKREEIEQWMIEAIKSAGVNISLMEYIKKLAEEIKT